MVRSLVMLLAGLMGIGIPAFGFWEGESHFTLGVDTNSNLYEFEDRDVSAVYSVLKAAGEYGSPRQAMAYSFSLFDPWEGPHPEGAPSRMFYGQLNYHLTLETGRDFKTEFYGSGQIRDTKAPFGAYPVEETPYSLLQTGAVLRWRDRLKLTLEWSRLAPEDYTVFAYRKLQTSLQADAWKGPRARLYAGAGWARYDYDHRILVVPDVGTGPPTPPTFRTHRDTSWTASAGWEFSGSVLWQMMGFYQDTGSSISELAYTSWGFDGVISASPAPGWMFLAALRWEQRRSANSYLLLDPRVLTEAGTNYLTLRLRRNLKRNMDLELNLGRYVHDVRQDFFSAPRPRHKASLTLVVAL